MSDLQKYLDLPYTIVLRRDAEGDFVARVEELPGCSAHGKTREDALANLDEAKSLWISDCLESGDPVPVPEVDESLPSGKWLQRVPRGLHRKLQLLARKENTSFNQLVTSMLAEAVGQRSAVQANVSISPIEASIGNAWAEYFGKAQFEPTPPEWQVTEVTTTPVHFARFGFSQVLAHLSSGLPNDFQIPLKVKKDEKKKHTALEAH